MALAGCGRRCTARGARATRHYGEHRRLDGADRSMGGPGGRRNTKGPALNADPASQARLLDLQALDSSLDRLDHRRRTLPELATIDELTSRLREVSDALVTAETLESDLARDQRKAEGDVDQVRQRSDRDQQRLDAGQVSSPRELENLQSEIGSLARRRSDLEDVVLEIMERRELAQADMSSLVSRARQADRRARFGDVETRRVVRRDRCGDRREPLRACCRRARRRRRIARPLRENQSFVGRRRCGSVASRAV